MALRKYLYPATNLAELAIALRVATYGALIAGLFGIIHDQVTYTISPEYFSRMKFDQFRAWDFGFPPRVFVAEIGFLASWWVGFIAAWFLTRIAVTKFEYPVREVLRAMLAILGFVVFLQIPAFFSGPLLLADRVGWQESLDLMGVKDRVAFYRVAAIHLAGYAGALIGWIILMVKFTITGSRARCA